LRVSHAGREVAVHQRCTGRFERLMRAAELLRGDAKSTGTSAARDAKNPDELTNAIRRASGLRVDIISGEREAEWVFRGVTSDARLQGQKLLILDVGGGSTEFILGEGEHHSFRQSFPMGSVRLLEQLRPGDPPSLVDISNCRKWLAGFFTREISPALYSLLDDPATRAAKLVGTGGTATILARMEHRMSGFDRDRIESTRLSRDKVLEFLVHLWSLPMSERRKLPGLPVQRADVILMGVAIYEAVMTHFHFQELCVSTRGLRYGALSNPP
jgi:exopolyphosphatase/guanosine-5'-triphosphate,3'-diphosphate pyrophosphatase